MKKSMRRLWGGLYVGLMCLAFFDWHVFRERGFKAALYDTLGTAIGVSGLMICAWLFGRFMFHKKVTTLGIGEATTKKLR
jgi:hypothetical protein